MNGVTTDFSGPYEPAHIALIESFNGKCLAECLDTREFLGLDDAVRKCGALRGVYKEMRPSARSATDRGKRSSSLAAHCPPR
ncbi:integrase core domain-containing protein [Erythrobacter sp. Dej080120_24]|uniref:integrase core domain-containing protein n=1 Tax=Erythrobacter sp. Dej080120_24 TaxID=3024837 RepID=UPI00403D9D4E